MPRWIGLVLVATGCGPSIAIDDSGASVDGDSTSRGETATTADDDTDATPSDPSTAQPTGDPDGTDASESSSVTIDPTGPSPSTCGDGVEESDELCDDGNLDDGDACSSTCAPTFEVVWTASWNGSASSIDTAADVIVTPDGDIYVVGTTRVVEGNADVWLQHYLGDGTPGATFTWDGTDSLADGAEALAWTPEGRIAIVGSTESAATGVDALVLLFDPSTEEVVWSRAIDGSGEGSGVYDDLDDGVDVAIGSQGEIIVAATLRVGGDQNDAWVRALSATTGETLWAQPYDMGDYDHAHAVVADARGISLLVEHDASIAAFTASFDTDGTPSDGGLEHPFAAHDLAWRSGVGYAVAGMFDDGYERTLVVSMLSAGGRAYWTDERDAMGDDDAFGVALGPANEVAAVGRRGADGRQDNAWIRVWHDDGTPWWSDGHDGPASLDDTFRAVVIDADGYVIVVGTETVIGEQSNALVRKYLPL